MLLSQPNEPREPWQEATLLAEWQEDVADLIDKLERPPREGWVDGPEPVGRDPEDAKGAVPTSDVVTDADAEVFGVPGGWLRRPGQGS